jgi:hypothetical protein
LENAKESAGLQTARTLALADFQYANDNGYAYASGTKSEDVAVALILGQYITDPSIFSSSRNTAFAGSTNSLTLTSGASAGFPASAICWDFMAGSTPVPPATVPPGLTTSDPDGMPVVFSTGQSVIVPTQGPGGGITLGTTNPFGQNGVAVCFKSNSAQFLKATVSGGVAEINTNPNNYLFNASFTTAQGATYTQLKP